MNHMLNNMYTVQATTQPQDFTDQMKIDVQQYVEMKRNCIFYYPNLWLRRHHMRLSILLSIGFH